jgi:hypothetical protein
LFPFDFSVIRLFFGSPSFIVIRPHLGETLGRPLANGTTGSISDIGDADCAVAARYPQEALPGPGCTWRHPALSAGRAGRHLDRASYRSRHRRQGPDAMARPRRRFRRCRRQ